MGIFSRKDDYHNPFVRNEKVVAAYDLPGVPERTPGVVKMVNGFEWRRYMVFFENGVQLGSLDGSALVRPKHWRRWCEDKDRIAAKIAARLEAEATEQENLLASLNAEEDDAAVASAGEAIAEESLVGVSDSGTAPIEDAASSAETTRLLEMLPEHLRERSRLARERLSG